MSSLLSLPLWVAGIVAVVGLPAVGIALRARGRPELLRGPTVVGAGVVAIVGGLALVIYAEAAGAPTLLGGGILGFAGVGVLTGAIAALPDPEGAEGGH
ncbi:MAG: hypothetical protein ABEH40_03795 [Haloferacaceae archaeon]